MPKVTFHGHSCFLVEDEGGKIIIDPFLSGNPQAKVSAKDINVDFVIVTHGHGDHLGDTVEIAKRCGATCISNFEIVNYCQGKGVKGHPLHIGGAFEFPFGKAKLTIAHHGSSFPDGTYAGAPCGVVLDFKDGKKIYHAGDTGLFYDMKLIGEEGLDLALIPIGDNFTMGISDAVKAVRLLSPKTVIPMHYNTFDVIGADPKRFKEEVEVEKKTKVVILKPGESFEF